MAAAFRATRAASLARSAAARFSFALFLYSATIAIAEGRSRRFR